jgi:DNA-binding NtrC family response regulator
MKPSLLIIEDEKLLGQSLAEALETDFETRLKHSGEEGIEAFKDNVFDFVLLDIRLPGMDGIETLKKILSFAPLTRVIMMTAYGTMDVVVEAIRAGAYTFIKKPFKISEIRHVLKKTLNECSAALQRDFYKTSSMKRLGFEKMIGQDKSVKGLQDLIKRVARSESTTVLITGESGTGKELVAKALYDNSPRAQGPFVDLNCAALASELLESELFGYEKGAFTDARNAKKGLCEIASGGVLFLDEIGEMPLALQAKLLRFMEEKKFRRIGGTGNISVDVRIIAATNKDLSKEVKKGTFREDLFFRLNVFPLHLPPLRERKGDIPLLADYFLKFFSRDVRHDIKGFQPDALDFLMKSSWPGNVRELRNTIERAMITSAGPMIKASDFMMDFFDSSRPLNTDQASDSQISASDQKPECTGDMNESFRPDDISSLLSFIQKLDEPDSIPGNLPEKGIDFENLIGNLEKVIIKKAMDQTKFNQSKSSRLLGLSREMLRYRIKKYNLE